MDTHFPPFSATLSPVSLWLCSCTAACIMEAILVCTDARVCVCVSGRGRLPRHLSLHQLASVPATSQLSLSALHTHTHTYTCLYSRSIHWLSHSPDVCHSALQGSSDDVHGLSCGTLKLQAKHGFTFRTEIYFWLKWGRSNAKLLCEQRLCMCTNKGPKWLRLYTSITVIIILLFVFLDNDTSWAEVD